MTASRAFPIAWRWSHAVFRFLSRFLRLSLPIALCFFDVPPALQSVFSLEIGSGGYLPAKFNILCFLAANDTVTWRMREFLIFSSLQPPTPTSVFCLDFLLLHPFADQLGS